VRATAGFRRSDASFGAFVVVHMMTSVPFQVNAIGTTLGVPSLATYSKRARSRLSISWLIGFFRISATSLFETELVHQRRDVDQVAYLGPVEQREEAA
jgi:hypothetical protein